MFDGKQISRKLVGSEDERAVSPVIGVILMVAITVILAAVIAAFVLDLGSSVGEEPQAGVSIDDSNQSAVEVSVTSMGNSDGVVIVDDDGDPYTSGGAPWLNNTGASGTVNVTDGEANAVVAYIGNQDDVISSNLSDAQATSTVANL